jgi:hypothetical protein
MSTNALKKHVGVSDIDVVVKLFSFGVDGANVFQEVRNGVTRQIQDKYVPHLEGIHWMTHHINLVVQTLFHILVVKCIEDLF